MPELHSDPIIPVLIALVTIFIASKIGAVFADKINQPVVLGELLAGIVAGNLSLASIKLLDFIKHNQAIEIFSGLGVIILLFEVGLETRLKEMMSVGIQSLLVAVVGVITPFVLGYYVSAILMPDLTDTQRIFIGATLTATSVGIAARVFKDLAFTKSEEARIVLGAAVIDDILGLIILAVVAGIASTGSIDLGSIALISAKAIAFVVFSIIIGLLAAKYVLRFLSIFKLQGMMLISAMVFCFLGAIFANQAGLATIVGAFCAGLLLEEDRHFSMFQSKQSLEEYIRPISIFFVPVFFVFTGMKVDLAVFTNPSILGSALLITTVAVLGKLLCAWSFPAKNKIKRSIIGVGMIPRGEVGLIFATVGQSLGVINDELYAITVIMVILSTLLAPPVLNHLIKNK
jgi:Kef-type K+ transport system membrane component KefB